MLIVIGLALLVVAIVLHVAWVIKQAEARGRNIWGWVALALVLGGAGMRAGIVLFAKATAFDNDALMVCLATAPFTLTVAPMVAVALVLRATPVRVAMGASWPVFTREGGAATLVIENTAIELRWADRTERVERDGLIATADHETVRLTWPGRELVLMPTGKPATRDGRVRQAETIADRLRR
jgi:hypothetical protein